LLVASSIESTRPTTTRISRRSMCVAPGFDASPRAGRAPLRWVLAAFVAVAVVVTVVVAVTAVVSRDDPYLTGRVWLDGWFHGDAVWYCRIADAGYSYTPGQQSSVAFFPVFPMLLRGVGSVFDGNYEIAGSVIGVVAGGAAVVVFARWVWPRFPRAEAVTAIAVLQLYPYSFFLSGAAYSDGLFTGVASLRIDFAGSGDSEEPDLALDYPGMVTDAAASVDYLRADPRFDPTRFAVLGLSRGGAIAATLAGTVPGVAALVEWSGAVYNGSGPDRRLRDRRRRVPVVPELVRQHRAVPPAR